MAGKSGAIANMAIRLTLVSGPFTHGLRKAKKTAGSFAKQVAKFGKAGLAGAAVAGFAVMALGLAGLANEFRKGIAEATKYQEAIAEVKTIAGAAFSTDAISGIAQELTVAYGSDQVGNVKALYQAISSGVTTVEGATDLLHVANQLAIGGVTDITTAVDGLTNVVNAYAASGLTAADAADVMFVAVRDGKTSMGELAKSLGQVAPIASQLQVPFYELAAAVAAITTNGVATAEAVTQVKSVLIGIAKKETSGKAQAAAAELGVQFSVAAIKAEGLSSWLDKLANKKPTESQLIRMFGRVEAVQAVLSLTANDSAKFNATLDDMAGRAGSAAEAFRTMTQTLGFQIQRWNAVRKSARIALGDTVARSGAARETLSVFTDGLARLTTFLNGPDGRAAVQGFFQVLAGGMATTIRAVIALDETIREVRTRWAIWRNEPVVEAIGADGLTDIVRRTRALREMAAELTKISLGRRGGTILGGKVDNPFVDPPAPTPPNPPAPDVAVPAEDVIAKPIKKAKEHAAQLIRMPLAAWFDELADSTKAFQTVAVDSFRRVAATVGDIAAQAVTAKLTTESFGLAVQNMAAAIVSQLVSVGVQMLITSALGDAVMTKSVAQGAAATATATATTAAAAASLAGAWGAAATAASVATMGAAAGVGLSAYLAALVTGTAATVAAQGVTVLTGVAARAAGGGLSGQAHDGMTVVPRTGSYLLEGGERIIKRKQNADLTRVLAEDGLQRGGRDVQVIDRAGVEVSASRRSDGGLDLVVSQLASRVAARLASDLRKGRGDVYRALRVRGGLRTSPGV